jgi:ribosomal peptide maturation radical SAM protein 1
MSGNGLVSQGSARIALVNMPFVTAGRPSIQCGLLKSAVVSAGYDADVFYLNLELASEIGAKLYDDISNGSRNQLIGEWLFSGSMFEDLPQDVEYLEACRLNATLESWGIDSALLCRLRNEVVPSWVDRWATEVDWGRYMAVGFTTSFEQNNASFALARRIKERYPEVVILFGGANFDGTMGKEYIRALPFIDFGVAGEGDKVLPEILACLDRGESPLRLRGLIGRLDGKVIDNGLAPKIEDMDSLPDPDYDDYFATLYRLGSKVVLGDASPQILVETSRGCWWGEKQHCTFCGLNGNSMKFRSKTPLFAMAQLERLSTRYSINTFEAVDNIIDYHYIENFCGPLSEQRFDYRIFYEVKSNLNLHQLRTMKRAGINRIQPGIESLSSHVLALMRKGVTMLRNVRLLKWSHYYGIQVYWNILTGFPGETVEDYVEQNRVINLLRHLPPPVGATRIWLERFSPYFFDRSFPVSDVRPLGAYRFIYPEEKINLDEVAYYFDYEIGETLPDTEHRELRDHVRQWRKVWANQPRPSLIYQRSPGWIQIADRRSEEVATHLFTDWEADIYELCGETERSPEWIARHLAEHNRKDVSKEQVQGALDSFCKLGLMLEEKKLFLSLALPINRNW